MYESNQANTVTPRYIGRNPGAKDIDTGTATSSCDCVVALLAAILSVRAVHRECNICHCTEACASPGQSEAGKGDGPSMPFSSYVRTCVILSKSGTKSASFPDICMQGMKCSVKMMAQVSILGRIRRRLKEHTAHGSFAAHSWCLCRRRDVTRSGPVCAVVPVLTCGCPATPSKCQQRHAEKRKRDSGCICHSANSIWITSRRAALFFRTCCRIPCRL